MIITKKHHEQGSVLMIAFLTMAVLTMICAISLHVTSQNANATTQTTSWQQALSAAEAAADQAMNALNNGTVAATWSTPQWYTVTGSLPTTQPTGGTAATGFPAAGKYNYCIPTPMTLQGEASNSMSMWVTIDTAGLALDQNGNQAYRVRAVGSVGAPGPARVSNQKMDNDLRKISLFTDRATGQSVGTQPMATRRIELIATPVTKSIWARAVLLKGALTMSGGGIIDSFDSRYAWESTGGLYDASKLHTAPNNYGNHGDVGTDDSTGSDLKNTYVYGSIQYSGPAIKNTTNVQGTISTPFAVTIPNTADPNWSNGQYTAYSSGSPPFSALTPGNSSTKQSYIKVNGDFTVPGGQSVTLNARIDPSTGLPAPTNYMIWVTGKFTTSGSGTITQDPLVSVTYVVDGDITTSGGSFNNNSGLAGNLNFVGVGTGKVTISGSANFIGTVNAPDYDIKVSGTGSFSGAIIGNTLDLSGGSGLHYDEALAANGGGGSLANFAYSSWFEDNSAPARGITY